MSYRLVPFVVGGPTGRAHLWLPCNHQRASLGWQEQQPGAAAVRRCRTCGRRYRIELVPDEGQAVVYLIGLRTR